ncbi:MAG: hypothetical protein IKW98_01865 [Prevotella sp.]|nr:hypothetical protein [Prevotella sp.]
MNRLISIFFAFIFSICISYSQDIKLLTCEDAWKIIKDNVLFNRLESINVYACDTILSANSDICTFSQNEKSPSFASWFFFIDDIPYANWEHPCRYVFVNIKDGRFEIQNRMLPPSLENMKRLISIKTNSLNTKATSPNGLMANVNNSKTGNYATTSNEHNYAIIINGGINKYSNHIRYWNDCSYIYSSLINNYYYKKENIFVLMSDGTSPEDDRLLYDGITTDSSPLDLDGDGVDDIGFAATPNNISLVFDSLSNILTSIDTLFIYTIDHGGRTSGHSAYLYLWNSIITDVDFAQEVEKVNAGKIIVCMGQCYSGGFIDNLEASNRVIMTACRYDEVSFTSNGIYDDFVYHWTSAINGAVGTDTNNDGFVSVEEAFTYAEANDNTQEHPQYSSQPIVLGNNIALSNFYIGDMEVKDYLYNSSFNKITPLSPFLDIIWTLSGYNAQNFIIEGNTPTANQCRITRKSGVDFSGSYNLTLTAQIMHNGVLIKTISKQLIAPYIEGNVVPCGYNVYSVVPHEANSTIEWEAEGSNITSPTDPLPSLPPEDPYAYVIANTEGRDIYGTLTATVKVGGSVIGTLEKVLDMSGLFSGTWWQQASALDTTNTSPAVFHHQDMLDIVPDRTVYLQSDDFIGANITKTINNMIALGWSNSNGIISFTPLLPINGGLGSITIEGTYPNSCRHFKLRLLTMSNFDDPILLSINPSGQTCGFSLISNQSAEHSTSSNSDIPTEWRLTITKSETGRRVFDSAVSGMSKTINTTEWRPGVYIAVAQVGKYTLSGKFAIER